MGAKLLLFSPTDKARPGLGPCGRGYSNKRIAPSLASNSMGVQLGVTELTRYGIGPCAHLSIRMHRPVMKINQQMVFGTKRRNMLRPAVLFLHISSHETVFYTGSAPARILCQGFFNGITFTAHIIQPKSVISVMMITTLVFVQMSLRFEGAMGFHCNRKTERQMTKRKFVCA